MKVEKINTKQQIDIEETIISYTKEDIETLIRADLFAQGYEAKSINMITMYEYETDEWGMNSHFTTCFLGVQVKTE